MKVARKDNEYSITFQSTREVTAAGLAVGEAVSRNEVDARLGEVVCDTLFSEEVRPSFTEFTITEPEAGVVLKALEALPRNSAVVGVANDGLQLLVTVADSMRTQLEDA